MEPQMARLVAATEQLTGDSDTSRLVVASLRLGERSIRHAVGHARDPFFEEGQIEMEEQSQPFIRPEVSSLVDAVPGAPPPELK
jgi:hypothetical protein